MFSRILIEMYKPHAAKGPRELCAPWHQGLQVRQMRPCHGFEVKPSDSYEETAPRVRALQDFRDRQ